MYCQQIRIDASMEAVGFHVAGNAPRWVYYFNGFSVFWYLHLDCLDGKQARRTKSSSPLGQLFDHGNTITTRSCKFMDFLCSKQVSKAIMRA